MKPMLIIPEGQMSAADKQLLNENGICTVEAKDPSQIKFVDPLPAMSSRTQIEDAAIKLSRYLMTSLTNDTYSLGKKDVVKLYVEFLAKGTPLDPLGTPEEQEEKQRQKEKEYFREEKRAELQRLAREEAKAERAARRKEMEDAKAKEKKPKA